MAQPVTTFSISAPGFYGLNLSDSPVDMSANFALEANNCVIDRFGRIASRKGWVPANTANAELSTSSVTCIGELVTVDGTATTLCTGGGYLFKLASGALTTLTYGGGGVAPTLTLNNWQFCFLNGIAIFWQRGYDPLIYDPAVSTTTFRRLNEKSGAAGTSQQANTAISAYGRIWCADLTADKSTIYFSDLLTPHIWTGGTAGSLDLRTIWPMGGDEIVALAAHNSFLFIFGRSQILIYGGADTPSTMSLKDTIVGIGCIARDSVQNIGEDVWFLSDSGVRSLLRTIQEKSSPIRSISKNVHEDLQSMVTNETQPDVKSGYSAVESIYLLTMPTGVNTYCFDTRSPMEDGSTKVTKWPGTPATAFYETKGRLFYTGRRGCIGTYTGYADNTVAYRMTYFTTWIDFGNPIQKSILKKIRTTLIGGATQSVVIKWAYDFSSNFFSATGLFIPGTTTVSEYGTAEYGIAEYSGTTSVNVLSVNGLSSGQLLQFGFEAEIATNQVSIQKIDLLTKNGRV